MDKAQINVEALRSLHRFGDLFEQAVCTVQSDLVELSPLRQAPDSNGPYWCGMRCKANCKRTGQGFYLHMGLIYLPETQMGLMVEVDRKNNLEPYAAVLAAIKNTQDYTVNTVEDGYIKLFMPDERFAALNKLDAMGQVLELAKYVKTCTEAIVAAAYYEPFRLDNNDLLNAYRLTVQYKAALESGAGGEYEAELIVKHPDNFGQYACGYRYWLRSLDGEVALFAYFGSIYSYRKSPSGVFVEIDQQSNPNWFEKAFSAIAENDGYVLSKKEPQFIKLFLPDDKVALFNDADEEGQFEILRAFLRLCSRQLLNAAKG